MTTGKIKFFDTYKGFGFIISDEPPNEEFFFHISNVISDYELKRDDLISFDITKSSRGGLMAVKVQLIEKN